MADAPVLETGPEPATPRTDGEFDVVIVGAGLSGIGAAWHMQQRCAGTSYAILEARDAIGGTWDLFRYPGIRSDSDMFTLGYIFRPWEEQKAIADGPSIRRYVNDTARDSGIDRHIRFRHKVTDAAFDNVSGRWTVTAETPDGPRRFSARMLLMAAGYYSYDNPYNPPLPGEDRFAGTIFHAQHWPQDLDHAGKRVVVIGSGATAVTIVPVVAETAAHVTMLQRSPTWMVSRPSEDRVANLLRKVLPAKAAYALVRWKNILWQNLVFKSARKDPAKANRRLLELLAKELPEQEVSAHFTPRYNVWEQRLCLVPDSDFFDAVKAGRAEVVTDTIDHLDEGGIVLASGRRLETDIVVKATGLNVQMMGGARIRVDGADVKLSERYIYRGMMIEGVPNLVYVFGYFNASWTLRADLTSIWFCRLLNEMKSRGADIAVPVRPDVALDEEPRLLTSGYVQRALAVLPKQSTAAPWRDTQDYLADRKSILKGPVGDSVLQFMKAQAPAAGVPTSASVPEPAE
ncbi:MAG: flavin-containing monooxygenase [Thermaurantiacus sp.]